MINKEVISSLYSLKNNGTILYPTDTVWGIGCDATNEKAVSKIFEIKKRENSKSLVILVDSVEMLKKYVQLVPKNIMSYLSTIKKPTTIIYRDPKGLAKNIVASDNTVAIRIVSHKFCKLLIQKFGKPIVSTSANISDEGTPRYFSEINESILDSVDHIVNLDKEKINSGSSSIIQIMDGTFAK